MEANHGQMDQRIVGRPDLVSEMEAVKEIIEEVMVETIVDQAAHGADTEEQLLTELYQEDNIE